MKKLTAARVLDILLPMLIAVFFLGLWEMGVLHSLLKLKKFQLPIPSQINDTLVSNLPKALRDLQVTVTGAVIGMLIGSLIGFCVAVIATLFPKWGYGGLGVVSALNAVPIVALSPIMNRWFATGMGQKVGVVMVVTMAAMALNAYRGLTDLKPFSLDLMKSYAAGKRQIFFKLRLPNCLPSVFTALKINITSAMIASLISEYFAASTSGLGFGIKDNLRKAEMAMGWSYILVAAMAGIVLYLVILMVERRAIAWHASQRIKGKR